VPVTVEFKHSSAPENVEKCTIGMKNWEKMIVDPDAASRDSRISDPDYSKNLTTSAVY